MLTDEELIEAIRYRVGTTTFDRQGRNIAKAQLQKAIPIIRQELGKESEARGELIRRLTLACETARKEEREKIIEYMFEHSTAYDAPNPWNLISVTLSKEDWQALEEADQFPKLEKPSEPGLFNCV